MITYCESKYPSIVVAFRDKHSLIDEFKDECDLRVYYRKKNKIEKEI